MNIRTKRFRARFFIAAIGFLLFFASFYERADATTKPIAQVATYIETQLVTKADKWPQAMILTGSDAPSGTTATLSAYPGWAPGAPVPLNGDLRRIERPNIIETLQFSFSASMQFQGVPTFKLTTPGTPPVPGPYTVEILDGVSGDLIVLMPSYARAKLTFPSYYSIPFKVQANHPYVAELLAGAPYENYVSVRAASKVIQLPPVNGIVPAVTLPSAKLTADEADSGFDFIASARPPVGIPALSEAQVNLPVYYASATVWGSAHYNSAAMLTVKIPESLGDPKSFRLAAYDAGFSHYGWTTDISPRAVSGNTLTFTLLMPKFVVWRQYGFALYKQMGQSTAVNQAEADRPDVVVIGDSLSFLTILPPSGTGCTPGWGPTPYCQFSNDPSVTWPGVLSKITGYSVWNLSDLGTQTTVDSFTGASILGLEVSQIPAATKVVIVSWGDNDLYANNQSRATSARVARMTAAIVARAPHARIVFLPIHCYPGCPRAAIDAWTAADKNMARKYGGAFFDLRKVGPDGINAQFPDSGHLSVDAARLMAEKIAALIRPWLR